MAASGNNSHWSSKRSLLHRSKVTPVNKLWTLNGHRNAKASSSTSKSTATMTVSMRGAGCIRVTSCPRRSHRKRLTPLAPRQNLRAYCRTPAPFCNDRDAARGLCEFVVVTSTAALFRSLRQSISTGTMRCACSITRSDLDRRCCPGTSRRYRCR